jgi:hypothetical protein
MILYTFKAERRETTLMSSSFEQLYNMHLNYKRQLPLLNGKAFELVSYFVTESDVILSPLKEKDGMIYTFLMDEKGLDVDKIVHNLRMLRDTCQKEYETHALMGSCDAFRVYIEDILYGGEVPEEVRLAFPFQHEARIYV